MKSRSSRMPSGIASVAVRAASRAQRALHGFGAFGEGSLIVPPYRLTCPRRMHIGARTVIGPYAFISVLGERLGERYDGVLRIGDDTSIGQNFIVSCAGSMVIGSDVLISSNVHIGDAIHGYEDPDLPVIAQPMSRGYIIVADGAFIGVNAVILPNVRIGRHAVVGAGAVVTRDVPDFCVVAGNPARIIRRYDANRRAWVRTEATPRRLLRTAADAQRAAPGAAADSDAPAPAEERRAA
jgi:acetyltransferase-like isoleucine patch superfamily enzyme